MKLSIRNIEKYCPKAVTTRQMCLQVITAILKKNCVLIATTYIILDNDAVAQLCSYFLPTANERKSSVMLTNNQWHCSNNRHAHTVANYHRASMAKQLALAILVKRKTKFPCRF